MFAAAQDPREAWLEERRSGLGGSDVAAVLGLSPFRTAADVWADKTCRVGSTPDNPAMRWGRILEPVILRTWAEDEGHDVLPSPGLVRHPTEPWALGSPDAYLMRSGCPAAVVEIKTASAWVRKSWGRAGDEAGDGTVPDAYLVQVQWYMWITGLPEAHVVVLIDGRDLRAFPLVRDDALIASMASRCREWWQTHVVADVPPPNTPPAMLYPADDGTTVELDDAAAALMSEYHEAGAIERAAKAERERLRDELLPLLAEHRHGIAPGWRATWQSTAARTTVDAKALKKGWPDVFAAVSRVGSEGRRLTVAPEVV